MRTPQAAYRVSDLAASLGFRSALGYDEIGRVDIGEGATLTMPKLPDGEVARLEPVHRPVEGQVDRGRVQPPRRPGRGRGFDARMLDLRGPEAGSGPASRRPGSSADLPAHRSRRPQDRARATA